MIDKITINNFKSIADLTVGLGRVNVIIGENGCGKTNFLEAIAFAAAASQRNLNNTILGANMRVVPKDFMYSAFEEEVKGTMNIDVPTIDIKIEERNKIPTLVSCAYSDEAKQWINIADLASRLMVRVSLNQVFKIMSDEFIEAVSSLDGISKDEALNLLASDINLSDVELFREKMPKTFKAAEDLMLNKPKLNSYVIYSPEEQMLRRFSDDSQITPLGRRGEGLFQYLKDIAKTEQATSFFMKLKDGLQLLDWFDDFKMPEDLLSNEYRLNVADKYLKDTLHYFDQRSTNEGFLYLLFYLTLFNSSDTPSFFAIDNIETSFNPKLSTYLLRKLIDLAKANDKQVIITTHSPFIIDALDLVDDDQRLFVARRNRYGHTVLDRIKPGSSGQKLSDLWMKGIIGGLPDNF